MSKEDIWNLFRLTGKLEHYMVSKQMDKRKIDKIGSSKD